MHIREQSCMALSYELLLCAATLRWLAYNSDSEDNHLMLLLQCYLFNRRKAIYGAALYAQWMQPLKRD